MVWGPNIRFSAQSNPNRLFRFPDFRKLSLADSLIHQKGLDVVMYFSTLLFVAVCCSGFQVFLAGGFVMVRTARADLFDPQEISVFHCTNRCVRACYLCGEDPLTGNSYEHRKAWIEQRLMFQASCFGMDVLGFSIMSNHFHVILRNRPDLVVGWSDREVARRWLLLCPIRKKPDGTPEEPTEDELDAICHDPARLAQLRTRLSSISWYMAMVAEPVARRANAEDGCAGRFWQGRFRAVKLCDDAAILACSVYVDLNPVRAGCCSTPETSDHTSAQRRIEQLQADAATPATESGVETNEDVPGDHPPHATPGPADWLAPLELNEVGTPGPQPSVLDSRASDKGFLPMTVADYLELLDWTGRQVVTGKVGVIPEHLSPILTRLGISGSAWFELTTGFGRQFQRVAGCPASVAREAARRAGRRRFHNRGRHLLGSS